MDTRHVETEGIEIPDDVLSAIFSKQEQLMEKYQEIEQLPEWPFNLHIQKDQLVIKDFCWRATEEFQESIHEIMGKGFKGEERRKAVTEELIDALHFYTENMILSGISPNNFVDFLTTAPVPSIEPTTITPNDYFIQGMRAMSMDTCGLGQSTIQYITQSIYYMGMACNQLKNKPWKRTHQETDIKKFNEYFCLGYMCCINAIFSSLTSVSAKDLYSELYLEYFKKHAVNQFRQGSNY